MEIDDMNRIRIALLSVLLGSCVASAQPSGVLGLWTEPTGSTIEIFHCGSDVCARLVAISPNAPSILDIHNPDAKLRTTPLCGLVMGRDFHLSTPEHADGGHLYDPKSGKTYSGSMSSDGNHLDLRGYVGIKLFGRSETWTRANTDFRRCNH
jgi:uncharacterized protein (DUF2147 family)